MIFLIIANSEPVQSSLTADSVRTFLIEHPDFLDSYIQQHIDTNTIEVWLSKKSQKTSWIDPSSSTSMPMVSSNNNGISASIKTDGKTC